jgi:ribose transport system substrate-binding protein
MKKITRIFIIFICVLFLVLSTIILCGWGKKKKSSEIAVLVKTTNSSYWQVVKKGAMAAKKDLKVKKVSFDGPPAETDINGQVAMVENAINRKVLAIVLAPCDVDALVPVVKKAQEAGITIITIDTALNHKTTSFLTTDNVEAGRMAARELIKNAGTKGKVALMSHVPGAGSAIDRNKGFVEVIKSKTSMKIIGPYFSQADMATALNQTTDVLAANPDLVAIFGTNEPTAIGMARAIEEAGKKGKITAIGFDGAPQLQEFVEKGVLQAIMVQSPYNMGYLGVKTALDASSGKKVKKFVDTGVFAVTTENIKSAEAQKALGN